MQESSVHKDRKDTKVISAYFPSQKIQQRIGLLMDVTNSAHVVTVLHLAWTVAVGLLASAALRDASRAQ